MRRNAIMIYGVPLGALHRHRDVLFRFSAINAAIQSAKFIIAENGQSD